MSRNCVAKVGSSRKDHNVPFKFRGPDGWSPRENWIHLNVSEDNCSDLSRLRTFYFELSEKFVVSVSFFEDD